MRTRCAGFYVRAKVKAQQDAEIAKCYWVTIHKAATVYTRIQTNTHSLLRELSGLRPFRRVVDIVSHLELRRQGNFARKPANPPSYGVWKDCNLICSNCTTRWPSPRHTIVQSHWCTRGGSSRKLKNKPRLVEPFYDGYIYS